MGKLFSCPSSKPEYSADPAREAIELHDASGNAGHGRFGEPLSYEVRRAVQDSYKAVLHGFGKRVASKLGKCDCPKEHISEFNIHGKLGKGSFGVVVVGTYTKDNEDYAIKIQRKLRIERSRRIQDTIREKNLQWAVSGRFVVELHFTHQDKRNVYMVLEYSPYGDFARCVINNYRFDPTEDNVKLHAAQIVLALEYVHACDVVLRDLKPENIIVFPDGYLKLSDFGLSKVSKKDTYTSCGTLAYMAPELVLRRGHRTAVDWWAFGVVLYEMLHGKLPFYVEHDSELTKKNITSGSFEFNQDLELSSNVRCLIEQLLQVSPAARLGNLTDKADDVKLHPWFSNINFTDVYLKRYEIDINCVEQLPDSVDILTIYGPARDDEPYKAAFAEF